MRPIFRNFSLLFCALALSCQRATNQTALALKPETPLKIGRWTARWQNGGLYLDYDQVPLTRGGLVQVFAPNYARGYYGSGSRPPGATVAPLPDGGRVYTAQFQFAEDGRSFDGTQTIEVHPTDRVVYRLHARWQAPDAALLEWNPLRIWAYPLVGANYAASCPEGPVTGRIGYRALPGSYPATRLAPPWSTLTLTDTAVGVMTLSGQVSPDGPIVYDGREDRYLQGEKLFWAGYPALALEPGKEIASTLTLTVAPHAPAATPAAGTDGNSVPLHTAIHTLSAAQISPSPLRDRAGNPVIVPQPKQAVFTEGGYPLRGALPVAVAGLTGDDGSRVRADLERLTASLRRDAGVCSKPGVWRGRGLLVTVGALQGHGPGLGTFAPPMHAEGYVLQVTPQYVAVIGADAAGAFYGLQTLRQLLRHDSARGYRFAGVTVKDWPSLPFRGAHIFVGRNALPFHKKLIERIFSRYKLNKLVIECEYTAWKSHPEIRVDYSMPLDDLKADVAFARDHFMEPIPLVNSLGHSQWIFANGQHRDIVEDPRVAYAYNVSDPATYRFLFDIYQETLDIFHPRLFHIGHDEVKIPGVDQFGRYPARPENIRRGLTALFVADTVRLADWLRQRGARTMLWGDMLLHNSEGTPQPDIPFLTAANATSPEEARDRRTQLPHDLVVADWRYAAGSEQRNGLAALRQAGFTTVGCAWYEPENIRGWAQQAIRNGALGTLQTTWAGYDSNESLLDTGEYKQFTAFILAAEYAWSGSTLHPDLSHGRDAKAAVAPDTLPYTAEDLFARSYRDLPLSGAAQPGWILLPGSAANIRLTPDAQQPLPWTSIDEVQDHSTPIAVTNEITTGSAVPAHPESGIMLRSALSPPQHQTPGPPNHFGDTKHTLLPLPPTIALPVNRRARTLAFLHAAAYGVAFKAIAGTYTVVYADGKRQQIPLRYGLEIRSLDDSAASSCLSTTAVTTGSAAPLTLREFQWPNPRPDVEIARIELRAGELAAPILFSVTGIR